MENWVKKISVKMVCGNPVQYLGNLPEIDVMQVFGEITEVEREKSESFKDEEGKPRESWRLGGQFKAQNIHTRKWYIAGTCYLPDLASDMLASAFQAGKAKGMQYMQFAVIIGVKQPPEDAMVRYNYTARSVMPMDDATDPFRAIESKVKEHESKLLDKNLEEMSNFDVHKP